MKSIDEMKQWLKSNHHHTLTTQGKIGLLVAWEEYKKKDESHTVKPVATVTGIFLDHNNQHRTCIDVDLPLMTELFAKPVIQPRGKVPAKFKNLFEFKPAITTGPCGQCKSSETTCYCSTVVTVANTDISDGEIYSKISKLINNRMNSVRVPMTSADRESSWLKATINLPSHKNCYIRGLYDAEYHHGIKK